MGDFPATKICHWTTGPVFACDEHANQLVNVGKVMGFHIGVQDISDGLERECDNCRNEAHKATVRANERGT